MNITAIEPVSKEPFEFGPKQTAWLEALESGKYEQGRHLLKKGQSYCCLGVLCELDGLKYNDGDGFFEYNGANSNQFLPGDYASSIGLRSHMGEFASMVEYRDAEGLHCCVKALTEANDSAGWSFKDIAAYIRHDPHNVFTKVA